MQGGWGRVDVTFGSSGGKTTMKVNNIGDSWVLQNLGFAVDWGNPNYTLDNSQKQWFKTTFGLEIN